MGGVSLGNPPRSCDVKPNGQLIKKMIKRLTVHSPLFFRKIVEIERFALRPAILPMSPLWLMFRRCAHYDCDALWIQNFQDGGEGREISQVICFVFQ